MIGTSGPGIVLQGRDRKLLAALETLRLVDREQASEVAPFASKTRANARLLALTRAGLLRRRFVGTIAGGRRAIYELPRRRSRSRLSANTAGHVEHQLAVNAIYLALTRGVPPGSGVEICDWRTFDGPISPGVALIPDGYAEVEAHGRRYAMFVEVDRGTEPLRVWRGKGERYLDLARSGEFERLFGRDKFRVLVVAPSERRMEHIRRTLACLTDKVFRLAVLETINRDGLSSAVWLRPAGDERQPLF